MRAVINFRNLTNSHPVPSITTLPKDGLKMTPKERAGVLEVLFGVSFGGGETRKRFVEQGDDSLLFGEWGRVY